MCFQMLSCALETKIFQASWNRKLLSPKVRRVTWCHWDTAIVLAPNYYEIKETTSLKTEMADSTARNKWEVAFSPAQLIKVIN